jgi:hypothetical protein
MESQKGLAEQSLRLIGEGMRRGDCMCSLTEKTQTYGIGREARAHLCWEIFEYMYVVLSFIRGPWLSRAPNFVMLVMPELFSGYVIDLRLSC